LICKELILKKIANCVAVAKRPQFCFRGRGLFVMKKVEIYSKASCPFCHRAKALLNERGVQYEEYRAEDAEVKEEMIERAGRYTVPQIFIGGAHVGGCDDLYELEAKGQLDSLL